MNGKYMAQQCHHEGCQRRELEAEVKRLKGRVADLEAFLRELTEATQDALKKPVTAASEPDV